MLRNLTIVLVAATSSACSPSSNEPRLGTIPDSRACSHFQHALKASGTSFRRQDVGGGTLWSLKSSSSNRTQSFFTSHAECRMLPASSEAKNGRIESSLLGCDVSFDASDGVVLSMKSATCGGSCSRVFPTDAIRLPLENCSELQRKEEQIVCDSSSGSCTAIDENGCWSLPSGARGLHIGEQITE